MAKRNLPHKLNCKRARQKRENKREERRTKMAKATHARWAKKAAPQPDTDAEKPQPSEEGPSTSEATAQDNDGQPSSTPTPVTPLEMDVPSVEMMVVCHSLQRLPTKTNKFNQCRQHRRHAVTWWRHHRLQRAPVALVSTMVGRYSHLGTQEKIVEKLVKHTTMLNALHDRGVENNKENDKYPDF